MPKNLEMELEKHTYKMLADTFTPVSLYLKLRDHFDGPILLESNLNQKRENSKSFICLNPISTFKIVDNKVQILKRGLLEFETECRDVEDQLNSFRQSFRTAHNQGAIYGHTNFEAVRHLEDISFPANKNQDGIPEMNYSFYQFVIEFNHFNNELLFTEFVEVGFESQLNKLVELAKHNQVPSYSFKALKEESSFTSPEEFKKQVAKAKNNCQQGDVFQLVVSRRFQQSFKGDDFEVYRRLRSINPSPYLFYFDFGSYKLFGSSPEAQVKVSGTKAVINPIAGTYKRTGNYEKDQMLANKLKQDAKENAEHVMLVDLARNDLGRIGNKVNVTAYKDIHFYSHVIHMVSEVEAQLDKDQNPIKVLGQTFPAGTLSGAPKYRAMQLLSNYEPVERNYYGGAIGLISLSGDVNHAIMIRSFLSHNSKLQYQAGAGVVVDSNEESELKEVDNKIGFELA